MNNHTPQNRHSFSFSLKHTKLSPFFQNKLQSPEKYSHLQLFKEKLMKGLQKHQQFHQNFKKGHLIWKENLNNFKPKHISQVNSRTVLNFVTEKKQENGYQFQDKQFRKSQSFLIMKRRTKNKQILALKSSEEHSIQFHKKRQIPIHHTYLHFNQTKTQPSHPSAHLQRNRKTIKHILHLQEEFIKQQEYGRKQGTANGSPIIVTSKYVGYQTRGNNCHQIQVPCRRQIKLMEVDIGPWKRSPTGDFQGFV